MTIFTSTRDFQGIVSLAYWCSPAKYRESTRNNRETAGNRKMITGKYRERCLFAEKVINDKNKDINHRKTVTKITRCLLSHKKATSHGKTYQTQGKPWRQKETVKQVQYSVVNT